MAKTHNTTDGFDMMLGIRTSRTDGPKGSGYGAGNNQEEANKSSYSSYQRADPNDSNFDSGSSGGGDSGGGGGDSCCYVTTACLDALRMPRDSLELKAMKVLTKEHVLKSFSGKKDYVAYQRKGPAIVQAIELREDKQNIWEGIYEKLKEVTSSVLSQDYSKGHQQYKDLILGLESQLA